MASRGQMVNKTIIPSRTKVVLSCWLTLLSHAPERIIESLTDKMGLANSVNQLSVKGSVVVQWVNPTNKPLELPARTTIRTFISIDQHNMIDGERIQTGAERHTH